jgi:hypothetical protein
LKNQDKFNKWAKVDPDRKWEYKGTDGTVGFIIAWNGNKKAGKGEKEIMKRIETQIRFIKPMSMTADIIMETKALIDNQTQVPLINLFIPIAEKKFPKDMDDSLATLKGILENDNGQ